MRMVREMTRCLAQMLMFLILLSIAGPVRAQDDDVARRAYAAVEDRTHAEYEYNMAGITRQMLKMGASFDKITPIRERMKMMSYNRATIFAFCAADAEKERGPYAPPIPIAQNLPLNTCLEIKLGELQKFYQRSAYADFFFPERITSCGEQSRMPEREQMLPPYSFLQIAEPKLYDFARYNECLMTP
jgi:hypothetical protein